MTSCAFCGRENDAAIALLHRLRQADEPVRCASRPRVRSSPLRGLAATRRPPASALRPPFDVVPGNGPVVPATRVSEAHVCPRCRNAVTPGLPFCGHCGPARRQARLARKRRRRGPASRSSANGVSARPAPNAPRSRSSATPGEVLQQYTLERGEAVSVAATPTSGSRTDTFMSPIHARLELRDGKLWLRDLGVAQRQLGVHRRADEAHRRRSDSHRVAAAALSAAGLSRTASARGRLDPPHGLDRPHGRHRGARTDFVPMAAVATSITCRRPERSPSGAKRATGFSPMIQR